MAKNLKLNIKNTQIAQAINLSGLKSKLAKKKEEEDVAIKPSPSDFISKEPKLEEELIKEETPRIKARSKSVFSEPSSDKPPQYQNEPESDLEIKTSSQPLEVSKSIFSDESEDEPKRIKTSAELRQDIFGTQHPETVSPIKEAPPQYIEKASQKQPIQMSTPLQPLLKANVEVTVAKSASIEAEIKQTQPPKEMPADKLGPTGRHIKDYYQPKAITPAPRIAPTKPPVLKETPDANQFKSRTKPKGADELPVKPTTEDKVAKPSKFKEFRDVKPAKKTEITKQFDARDRQGLRSTEEDQQWRKRRNKTGRMHYQEDTTIRPTTLKVRVPISIKDLASEMKLKASQLISKLFLQGMVVTLNDVLEDETTIQLLGHEFNCEIAIDSTNEKRIRITDFSIKEELSQTPADQLILRPPVVAFMGHVDHGKTSLIDSIRKSHLASGEAGAITQHIGAFRCQTPVGDIAILDTPGHEAFSAMRARGADVTDIVVLVVAGDEGIREQTIEAIQHAQAAGVIMVVAINKCDKPNFNAENVYRQLSEKNLLPEAWGGELLTVNCSATTGEGIPELLEMLALQAEILELRANPNFRARGTVLESEMHKGMGAVATILVQNGTLRKGDALVFSQHWGRVKTMHDEFSRELQEAGPSTPVEITGLSGLPEAGQEFIVVKTEKEAREIAGARSEGLRQSNLVLQQKKKTTIEHLFQTTSPITQKKILNLVLRADVQGSLEALKAAILKIESDKAEPNIIFCGIGEVSESDVQLAAASKAVILGFHTQIENHAEPIVKQLGIKVRLHDIIYHAVDDIRVLMSGLLEKIPQEIEKGKAVVKATFKSSHTGIIAGCQVSEGTIHRNHLVRVRRGQNVVWKGMISSLKRLKEDVREVQKGLECGIFLTNFADIQENDVIEAYEMIYITQEL